MRVSTCLHQRGQREPVAANLGDEIGKDREGCHNGQGRGGSDRSTGARLCQGTA